MEKAERPMLDGETGRKRLGSGEQLSKVGEADSVVGEET